MKTASLTSSLVAKKGQASPAVIREDASPAAARSAAADYNYYKAMTVKLDRDRYETLKNLGVKLDKKGQEIFIEAFDLWVKQVPAQV